MGAHIKDEAGHRYGRLTVLRQYGATDPSQRCVYWLCRCDCGTEVAVSGAKLRNGNTRSCGCLRDMTKTERLALGFEPIDWRKSGRK